MSLKSGKMLLSNCFRIKVYNHKVHVIKCMLLRNAQKLIRPMNNFFYHICSYILVEIMFCYVVFFGGGERWVRFYHN